MYEQGRWSMYGGYGELHTLEQKGYEIPSTERRIFPFIYYIYILYLFFSKNVFPLILKNIYCKSFTPPPLNARYVKNFRMRNLLLK